MSATFDLVEEGALDFCEAGLGWYWRYGRWTRTKLRGAALSDDELRDRDVEPLEILRAPFHVGYIVERIDHDGEWCDPRWPSYHFVTADEPGARVASWLELG